MSLCLVSRLSLDELEGLVTENFTGVENKNLPVNDFSKEEVFNEEHSFGRIYKIIPNKLMKSIILRWMLPPTPLFNVKKSNRYLSNVIGHEGPNSLLS